MCPVHGEERIYVWSAGGWNNWEAVCTVENTHYAVKLYKGAAIDILRYWLGSNTTNGNYQAWLVVTNLAVCKSPGPFPVPKP